MSIRALRQPSPWQGAKLSALSDATATHSRRHSMTKQFHLGWFTNFTADEWNTPFGNGGSPW
ncbi:hypothetical protein ABTA52_20720, partial [Acinetobacter baumannii]